MKAYPIRLLPVAKSPIWGGTRLKTDWGVETDAPTVGESWVLTLRKNEKNRVANGPWAGKTLDEVIGAFGASAADFPLLVKFIDAGDRLSVQVHPDDAYAARVENDRGKTEMWHILAADEGSELICGLREGITREAFAEAARAGDPERALAHIPVRPGETYFIPAGLPHAIGKGILLAEIQQNCDLTYRIWDYDRRGADGKPRELHLEKALDVVRPFTPAQIDAIRYEADPAADRATVLAACSRFRVERRTIRGASELPPCPVFRHLLCLCGEGTVGAGENAYPVRRADSYLLPPGEAIPLTGDLTVLLSRA